MLRKEKIISLLIVLLMVIAAAMTVNKSIFGHGLEKKVSKADVSLNTDTITETADGVVVIHTANVPGTINGYAGAVPLDIYISDGKISDYRETDS